MTQVNIVFNQASISKWKELIIVLKITHYSHQSTQCDHTESLKSSNEQKIINNLMFYQNKEKKL